jgi:hypothetical protein
MKTVLIILALTLSVSLTSLASNTATVAKMQTENPVISKASESSSLTNNKATKAHHKAHKKTSGKKAKK